MVRPYGVYFAKMPTCPEYLADLEVISNSVGEVRLDGLVKKFMGAEFE